MTTTDNERPLTAADLDEMEARLALITGEHWQRHAENQIEAVLHNEDGTTSTPLVAAANFVYNASFIAHSPDDVRRLINALRAAWAENARLTEDKRIVVRDYQNLTSALYEIVETYADAHKAV